MEINTDYDVGNFDFLIPDYAALNYFELENKFKFNNANIAIGIPIGFYSIRDTEAEFPGIIAIDPRAYFTFFDGSNYFELNVIPKCHVFYDGDYFGFMPGISVGLAFSRDLKKWAIRPELGYDGFFSFGVCLNMNLTNILKKK